MHRSFWNSALGAWVAVPENARSRGKRSASRIGSVCALMAVMWSAGMPDARACTAGTTAQLAACIAGSDAVIDLAASIVLDAQLPVVERSVTINGHGYSLDGVGQFRGFFIGSGTTTVNGLTMQNLLAQGGQGGSEAFPGGGGMGAGGAVFVVGGAGAILNDVIVVDNRAAGGSGGSRAFSENGGRAGGGGMGGDGSSGFPVYRAGDGGGGLFEDGLPSAIGSSFGGNGGGPSGGTGTGVNGNDGGLYSGGAGGGVDEGSGGDGGLGGGGGGSGAGGNFSNGGNGGFGGGGGGGYSRAGRGGFGGGGGGGNGLTAATGGFGGGNGGIGTFGRAGGGGAGMGGAIFVMNGGALTLTGSTEVRGNDVSAGASGGGVAQAGSAFGGGIFMQGAGSTLVLAPGTGDTQTVADAIADQTGSGGVGGNAGSIGLTKRGAGRLILSGTNTYSGGTTVNGGALSISADGNLGLSSSLLTLDGGTLQNTAAFTTARAITLGTAGGGFQTDAALASTGVVSGAGGLIKSGSGTLTLTGTNTYSGGTTIAGGELSVSADANLGAASGALSFDGGILQVTDAAFSSTARTIQMSANGGGFNIVQPFGTFSVGQVLTGDGGLTKKGAGTLVLSGANSYAGGTTLSEGVLLVSADNNLGAASGGLTFDGGTLRSGGSFTTARDIDLRAGGGTFQINNFVTASGVISGEGALTHTGVRQLTLSGVNTYSGGTTISNGILAGSATSFGSGAIVNNAALLIQQPGDGILANRVSGSGGLTKTGAGKLTLTSANSYLGGTTISAGILAGSAASFGSGAIANNAALLIEQPGDDTLANTVSGTGTLTKGGAGTLTVTGTNSYSGGTTLSGGKLSVSSDANLGATSGALTFDGGVLQVTGTAFASTPRAMQWGARGGGFDIVLADATFRVGQAIAGSGAMTKEGAGTLVLSGANSYTGGTTNSAGTLRLEAGGTLAGSILNNANLEIASADTGAVTAIQNNATLTFHGAGSAGQAAITNNATGVVDFSASAGVAGDGRLSAGSIEGAGRYALGANELTVGSNNLSTVVSGAIDGAGGSLVKSGTGTLTLAGTNTYTGGTTATGGVLSVSADQNLGALSGALTLDGATLQTTDAFASARSVNLGTRGGTLQTDVDLTVSGAVAGTGTLTKTGAGMLTLTGAGANSYTGGTDLKQGGIAVANNSALGTGELAMHEGTTLRFAADGLALGNPIAFTDAVDPIVDTGPFTGTLSGAITGPGDLSKIGSGTLILSGANSYGGATAVTEGTLRAGAANTFSPASAHSVAPGATLDLAGLSQSVAGLANAGTVSLVGNTPGTTLTVIGPHAASNGLLRLGTFLGDSASASDRLILSGPAAVASGRTTVQVVNFGGLGALTSGNGIELVSALNGATTTAQTSRDAFALQGGHVDAGAYEYRLQPGDAAGAGENWYLRSTSTLVTPPVPTVPAAPVSPGSPVLPGAPVLPGGAVLPGGQSCLASQVSRGRRIQRVHRTRRFRRTRRFLRCP
ncbi:autotransporter-associated beta strand repeat-containing protein [Variovorax sp. WDL1]|uniref:autotransporter-associated beta strand repeat-containing protein n=1 Tax=Variovorax sp. WDL1 TaxID=207745 RepID=UPI0022B2A6CF|nr:autotransporter-associated beta strand repeat-containing protein [Variovorax sp. WDL1]